MASRKEQQNKQQSTRLFHDISSLASRLVDIHQKAKELGIFVDDRELLRCPQCGLAEDVTCEGRLTTVQPDDENYADTGMRFEEIDATHFRCPQCRHVLVVMDEEEARNGG